MGGKKSYGMKSMGMGVKQIEGNSASHRISDQVRRFRQALHEVGQFIKRGFAVTRQVGRKAVIFVLKMFDVGLPVKAAAKKPV